MAPRFLIVLSLGGFMLTGCVAQEKYNSLKVERDQLLESLQQAQTSERAATAEASTLRAQYERIMTSSEANAQRASLADKGLAEAEAQRALLEQKYRDAIARDNTQIIVQNHLPAQVNDALKQLAAQHGDVLEYDASRGMLRFKSDVTFAKGSADLTPQAKSAVTALARVLNSDAAKPFDLFVAGHTDNTPVNNPNTKAAGHKDNWYLSSHRAITVAQELMSHNVASSRIGALGYADQRPVASNTTTEGQARNRRVEVVILPSRAGGTTASTGNTAPVAPKRTANPALNKDTPITNIERGPVLNK